MSHGRDMSSDEAGDSVLAKQLGTELTAPASRAVTKVCSHIAQSIRDWEPEARA